MWGVTHIKASTVVEQTAAHFLKDQPQIEKVAQVLNDGSKSILIVSNFQNQSVTDR